MDDSPELRIVLYRQAETAWQEVLRPWFRDSEVGLTRSYVVVPTRGQAYGLKLRCLTAGVPLLGVEFLTPGLARKKWLPLYGAEQGGISKPAAGREILLLGLRVLIEQRLNGISSQNVSWGFWKSLQSDPERVLDDFDDLLKAGFRYDDFGLAPLREIFRDLSAWVSRLGYEYAPLQSEAAALTLLPANAQKLGGRLMIYGLSAELWPEFSNVAALARRFSRVTVALPEPEFRGRKHQDENWVELWEALLGTPSENVVADLDAPTCESVGRLWKGGSIESHSPAPALPARVVVGATRRDEMALVANEIAGALSKGADHVGVLFPGADAAHGVLRKLLQQRGIPFYDAIEAAGTSSIETEIQRSLLLFYIRGSRLEDLLELWPLLKAVGQTALPQAEARDVCERLFDEKQTHGLAVYIDRLEAEDRPAWKEVTKFTKLLLPPFEKEITISHALERFSRLCEALDVPVPSSLGALASAAERETNLLPSSAVLSALLSFVPEGSALQRPENRAFARVTLLTRRRAEGLQFSHLVLTEANAGVWPRRTESSPWLPDEHKDNLNESSRFSLGLFTSEDRATLEKQSYCALARDTAVEVIFTAALFDEAQPESRLAPNSWVERVLWSDAQLREAECDFEQVFAQLAVSVSSLQSVSPPETPWLRIWNSRRDPMLPFDQYFLSVDPVQLRPDVLSARLLERAVQDPAELWFQAVLGAPRVDWKPFVRTRKKALGQWVHRVLASALQPDGGGRAPRPKYEEPVARERLRAELARIRSYWPHNQYWDSFHLELSRACENLITAAYALPTGDFVATELPLPWNATVPIGNGERLRVRGRVDLVWFDRTQWEGAKVDIVDFKTGSDAALSTQRMANDGFALQLGVYLSAAESLGAASGRVWMLKPELNGFSSLELNDLPAALVGLNRVGRHLRTGIYGALTPDASEYAPPAFTWPIACVPISEETLQSKFSKTFQGTEAEVPFE